MLEGHMKLMIELTKNLGSERSTTDHTILLRRDHRLAFMHPRDKKIGCNVTTTNVLFQGNVNDPGNIHSFHRKHSGGLVHNEGIIVSTRASFNLFNQIS